MNEAVIALTACFALLIALLGVVLIYSRAPLVLKAALVACVAGSFYLNYLGLERLLGWPASAGLPDRFMVLASSVREPDRASGDPGLIHLWATSLDDARPAEQPRAYELPYTRELHYALQRARQRQGEGIAQIGRRFVDSNGDRPSDRTRFARQRESFYIEDLPDPVLPEK